MTNLREHSGDKGDESPPTVIKAVVFDLGKVLVDFDYAIAVRRIAARGKLSYEDIARSMTALPLLLEYESGKLTNETFFRRVCEFTGYCGDIEEFAAEFGDIFTPIEPMIAVHREICRRGWPTFIFSNTNDLAIRHIRKNFPFFSSFTGYVLSYQHGLMKPAAEFYEALERQAGLRGPEIFYLDDRPENIAAGLERGWQGVVHQTPDQTVRAMTAAGLLENNRTAWWNALSSVL